MKTILIKMSGQLFPGPSCNQEEHDKVAILKNLVRDVKALSTTHHCSFVVGGGNFFRARNQGRALGLARPTADSLGMLATTMNALMLQDLFLQENILCTTVSALPIPTLIQPITHDALNHARIQRLPVIFAGGTGQPFFTTDTTGVIRALQIGADELWKGTNVDTIFSDDPATMPTAKPLSTLSHQEAIDKKLAIMDRTALVLAQENSLPIRVFNIFKSHALQQAAADASFGSIIQ